MPDINRACHVFLQEDDATLPSVRPQGRLDKAARASSSQSRGVRAHTITTTSSQTVDASCDRMTDTVSSCNWIIDTGAASHHVTGDPLCLTNIVRITGCPVGLPDGRVVVAKMESYTYLFCG
ncbi:unnamed protein product, partial [Cuscuta epithymum]